ncbi:SF1B family DNA helicase RecD2 [Candidatus Weimeria sp. HCP3S3_B5]|uniref:SF1B family DNA helicase RecD2 n=1 Tax=Candidatus Weimeria sp. HCP3S3_B5 TaxID=3438871 RepID=UPI003F8B8CFA
MMVTIEGCVDKIIYRNEDNAYTVLVLIPKEAVSDQDLDDPYEITCVGIFASVSAGENLRVTGDFVNHESFGRQLKMKEYEEVAPTDTESLERYLSSGAVKGIGPALASRIIKRFGDKSFQILETQPERLAEVKGISKSRAEQISADLRAKSAQRMVMLALSRFGITAGMSLKIYNKYGEDAVSVIKANPYRLAEEVDGIGFRSADKIALASGFSLQSEERARAGIEYVLSEALTAGNTYLLTADLKKQAMELLNVPEQMIDNQIFSLTMDRRIKASGDETYLYPIYRMEMRCASKLLAMRKSYEDGTKAADDAISEIESEEEMTLDTEQKKAVRAAAENGILILTGGPGTGKTTTIRSIIRYFEMENKTVVLAAPTGRAAKRMSQAVERDAMTIHRLLEVENNGSMDDDRPGSNPGMFSRNEDNPIEADAVIIDEMSMVDITIFYSLLRAVTDDMRLILVGDADQLPSVGPGNVLKDLIASEAFPVVRLTNIFRQKESGDIVLNAHRIKNGEPVDIDKQSRDFFFLKRYDARNIISTILWLLHSNLPKYVGADIFDIQVLSPTRKGLCGVENLNRILQDKLNPPSQSRDEKTVGEDIFRVGDKVMQTKNDYEMDWERDDKYGVAVEKGKGVYNGDLGRIAEINDYSKEMLIRFDDGHNVYYPYDRLDNLSLAYAMTIHKSQGSEYPAVIIPLLSGPEVLYNRNLLYTAVTRAKKSVILVGDEKVFFNMEKNDRERKRQSGLCKRIREAMGLEDRKV